MEIIIRKAVSDELAEIMRVYDSAREYMRSTGNMNQWVNGYPSMELVSGDIDSGNCYVGIDCAGHIAMVFAFIIGDDPTYDVIEDGAWPDNEPYGTIHRLASDGRYGRALERCCDFCKTKISNIRLDTHADNRPMQRAVARLGFSRCGIIYCSDGTPRIAYSKHMQ